MRPHVAHSVIFSESILHQFWTRHDGDTIDECSAWQVRKSGENLYLYLYFYRCLVPSLDLGPLYILLPLLAEYSLLPWTRSLKLYNMPSFLFPMIASWWWYFLQENLILIPPRRFLTRSTTPCGTGNVLKLWRSVDLVY